MKSWQQGILWAGVLVALVPSFARAGEPGLSGALFLRTGMGARAAGMGEAFTAVAADASSIYWNPAAMSPVLGTNVVLAHTEYFQSVRVEQAALTHEVEWGTIGLAFTGLYMDDLERREDFPSAIALGEFSVYDISFSFAYSRYITPNLTVGASIKPIIQRIDEVDATGVAFDIGVFHVSQIKGVNFAAVLGNLGAPMKFEQEEFALPRYFKLGG
ncbi:MAG: PorV/PorQ family protein, partial [Candidatus Krumholzibacteriota bacterium]|nr:PorV/PorQ family protein [Candidatus Krumholzibacteriota bacterium]